MAAIYKGTLGLIGNTPLVEPVNLEKELGLEATLSFSEGLSAAHLKSPSAVWISEIPSCALVEAWLRPSDLASHLL